MHLGDTIEFSRLSGGEECITVLVTKLHVFDSFKTRYDALLLEKCGYDPASVECARASDMNAYYSVEEQQKYGVLGIEFIMCCQ